MALLILLLDVLKCPCQDAFYVFMFIKHIMSLDQVFHHWKTISMMYFTFAHWSKLCQVVIYACCLKSNCLQGIPVAPLWNSYRGQFVGVLSALDFILILKEVRMECCFSLVLILSKTILFFIPGKLLVVVASLVILC